MAGMDFQAARVKMVDGQLRTTDVTSHELLAAFLEIPREKFVPVAKQELAYLDDDIEVAPGRYLMEPSPLAKLIQASTIKPTDRVLVVGSGVGYGAIIMSHLASHVVALEDNVELASESKKNVETLGILNIELAAGSLNVGAPSRSPYDVILIEGSVSSVPQILFEQLAHGGRLVAVEGEGLNGTAYVHTRSGSHVSAVRAFNLSVKTLPGFQSAPVFSF